MSNRKLHRISEPFGHGKDNAEKALTRLNDLKIHVNIRVDPFLKISGELVGSVFTEFN